MKNKKGIKYFIIDFDSTFVKSEGLEELAEVALKNNPNRNNIIEKIKEITDLGMEGKISFEESLKKRLKLLEGNKLHIDKVVNIFKKKVSTSIKRNREFFKKFKDRIFIISGGFKEFILPIVKSFYVEENRVLANTFILDKYGKIFGLDDKNILSHDGGKVKVVKDLKLNGEIIVIGDGYTDYQIKAMGAANHFVAFTENVRRQMVIKRADHIAPNFDEFLFINRLPRSLSYPKNRIKALILGSAERKTLDLFRKEGYQIMFDKKELKDIHILLMNSRFKDRNKIENAQKVLVLGIIYTSSEVEKYHKILFSTGSNNIINFANKRGIVIFSGDKENIARKIVEYINSGDTYTSLNLPHIRLKKEKNTHRLLHLHKNVPGILAKINGIMAKFNINILAQYLRTNAKIGYVITDVNKKYDKKVLAELKKIPHTIRFRVLY